MCLTLRVKHRSRRFVVTKLCLYNITLNSFKRGNRWYDANFTIKFLQNLAVVLAENAIFSAKLFGENILKS
jgi:hypothetical protein